jgi:protein-disulfide isomerase
VLLISADAKEDGGKTVKAVNRMFTSTAPLAALVVLALIAIAGIAPPAHAAAPAVTVGPLDQVMGKADAPVTVIEYASLTCPHCAEFEKETLPKIKAGWIDTGKARLIYRDFPTPPVSLSVGASMIVHCAGKAGYFPLLSLLFETQDQWVTAVDPLAALKRIVRQGGVTAKQVDACLARQDLADAIDARARAAMKTYGVDATPSLVIDGKVFAGAEPYSVVNKELQAAYDKGMQGRRN